MRIVQKYGGTSLADADRILRAARRVAELTAAGAQVVVVVSAQGDTTDRLITLAQELDANAPAREMDALLASGEQISAALTAMAIGALGGAAVSLTGPQAGIRTDAVHGNARIEAVDTDRLERELSSGKAVVVAGFQGLGPEGDITTLGRGGSDTTAVALAAALGADKCQIFTDVDGVYDRDPNRFPDAVRFRRIGYRRMLELAENGAQVLHDRCVRMAWEKGVTIEVLSSFADVPGTIVG